MSHQTRRPALPEGHPIIDVFSGWYWTSTTAAINTAYAWYIHMEGARVFYGRKEQFFLLWPVRGKADLTRRPSTWEEALKAVTDLNRQWGGTYSWRLPNINELESLVDCSAHSPALPHGHPFRDVREGYWSSTTSMFEPDWAWALYLTKGAVGVGQKRGAHFSVWAVCDLPSREGIAGVFDL